MNIYHYTSLDALTKILHKDHICFWGTRYDSMNDPTDSIYIKDVVLPLIKDAVEDAGLDDYDKDESEAFPYIVSFSREEDDFHMWRMYKADVALVFNREKITEYVDADSGPSFIYFEDCEYPEDEDDLHRKFIEKLNTLNKGQGMMLAAHHTVAFIKRKEFKNENEVRLVTFDHDGAYSIGIKDGEPELIEGEIPVNVGVKAIRDKDLVLYKEFHLPKETLVGIIINSNNDTHYEKLRLHIRLWLLQQGYRHNVYITKTESGNFINL